MPGPDTAAQTASWGRHADLVRETLERLSTQRVLQRLWDRDGSLWSAEPSVQSAIRNRLGWLSIAGVMSQQVEMLRRLAQELRGAGFSRALLLGMGGSALFPEVCRQTFGVASGHLDLTVLDTSDPTAIRAHSRRPLKQVCVIASSKSGTTSETTALIAYFHELFKRDGLDAGAHCLAITDAGTPLERQAAALQFRRAFVHGPGTGAEVGGRFSALTYFGLAPAALIGVDIGRLLQRAEAMFSRCGPEMPLEENPAAELGAALGALAQAGVDKVTLLCAPELAGFGAWAEQLIAENLGKQGRGIVPILGEPPREPAAYAGDRVFVALDLASRPDPALEAAAQALRAADHPIVRLQWQDPYDVGGEAAKWFVASAIVGHLMGINPFDEPNVQESKDRTKALLERYARERRFPEETPACSDAQVEVYGAVGAGAVSLTQCLGDFFRRRRPSDYVALLSFLPRTDPLDRAAVALRERLAARSGAATMLGVGPRYLHSTGQLYKGGPDGGLFLLLTADEPDDLPIPGEPHTFGALKRAQAVGDFEAMRQRGRRILRLHLRGDLERAMQHLARALDDAL
ncbi:MAG: hypothetical protein HYZ96_04285 [Candidatus Omnitrophica bacterium]|nr:hypothetical protein [Candidatus Omnitrophota bacterium]